jgi:N-acetylmuramoyl-L-alanine amidase
VRRDGCVWMSLVFVAASLAVSAVDIHERPHVRSAPAPLAASAHEALAGAGLQVVGTGEPLALAPGCPVQRADATEPGANAGIVGTGCAANEQAGSPERIAGGGGPQTGFAEIANAETAGAGTDDAGVDDTASSGVEPIGGADGRVGDLYPPPPEHSLAVAPAPATADGSLGGPGPSVPAALPASTAAAGTAADSGHADAAPPAADERAPALDDATVREAMRTAARITLPEAAHGDVPRPAGRWARLVGSDVEDELRCLALNIYWEARSEPALGRFAVAAVTLNRVGHRGFPNTICGVVRQGENLGLHRCQFSWVCDGKSNEPQNDEAWQEAENIAFSMLFLDLPDPTEGALWYHADYVSPGWAKAMARSTRIGRHLFYRDPIREASDAARLAG